MNREEAAHLSDVLKAYSEGKDIEIASKGCSDWMTYNVSKDEKIITEFSSDHFDYRIKPEPKYRPYKNAEEFLKGQKEHGDMLYNRVNGEYHHPVQVRNGGINVMYENNTTYHTFAELLKSSYNYTWQDGTKCGIIED